MFPGATADRTDADYVVIGAPLDVSSSFEPGSRFGPDRIRRYAAAFDDYDHHTGARFTDLAVHDHGDVRAWDDAAEYLEFLAGMVDDVCADGGVPILLGGEHTVSVAGIRAVEPDVVVCLDAHLDLRPEFDGNPLSHATVCHHALDVAESIVILGARTGGEGEWRRARTEDAVTAVPPAGVPDWCATAREALADGTVYLSVDIDAVDPGYAPGTGTKAPFGLDPATMRRVVRTVAPLADGFDVVEVTDRDHGEAATLAGKLAREFVFAHADGDPEFTARRTPWGSDRPVER